MAEALVKKRSDSYELLPPDMSDMRVVLLGNSWKQRGFVGNLLLKDDAFDTAIRNISAVKESRSLREKTISVINAPDLLHPDLHEDSLTEFITETVEASAPGPHVFLLVLQPEDFTEQHKTRLQSVLERLSDQAFHRSLVLISTPREQFTEKYVNYPPVRDMIVKCSYRYFCMTNVKDNPDIKAFKRKELLTRIGEIMKSEEHLYPEVFEDAAKQENVTISAQGSSRKRVLEHTSEPRTKIFCKNKKNTLSQDLSLKIVLFGKRGYKKTEGSNLITGNEEHHSRIKHSVASSGEWRGRRVTVVKTPDLFSLSVKALTGEMKRCVSLCSPGPNVLLLFVKPSELRENDRETLNFILSQFGPDAFKHSMVVITHDEKENRCVNEVIDDCYGRFYNMFEGNRQELMKKIENIAEQNRGQFLTVTKKEDIEENIPPSLNLVLCGRPGEKSSVVESIFRRAELPAASSPEQCVNPLAATGAELHQCKAFSDMNQHKSCDRG